MAQQRILICGDAVLSADWRFDPQATEEEPVLAVGTYVSDDGGLISGTLRGPDGDSASPDDGTQSAQADDYERIDPVCWRVVKLSAERPRGGRCDVTLLRPLSWIDCVGATVGANISFETPEAGVAGAATVLAIEPCPDIEPCAAGTRTVTGTFVTTNATVLDLAIQGLDQPIGTTPRHPFWSVDRMGWVAAGDLRPGEALRTASGSATVKDVTPRPGAEMVYNIEVHSDHTFFVSDAELWVHNASSLNDLAGALGYKRTKSFPFNSHGQPVYQKGTQYITADVDQHRGGTWKLFDSKGNRQGTYNADLTVRIGP